MANEISQQINTFTGGMNKDTALEDITPNQYLDANDVTIMPSAENEFDRVGAVKSMIALSLPSSIAYPTKQIWRVAFSIAFPSISHTFTFYPQPYGSPTTFTISSAEVTPELRLADLMLQLSVQTFTLNASAFSIVTDGGASGDLYYVSLEFNTTTIEYTATEQIDSGDILPLVLIQEMATTTGTPFIDVVAAKSIGPDMFMLINYSGIGMIAVAKKNYSTTPEVWTVTRLIQSSAISLDRDRVYEIQLEQNNDYINMYVVDGETAPTTFSIIKQVNWVTDSALRYTPTDFVVGNVDALYTYSNFESLYKLQVAVNSSYIDDIQLVNSGGVFTNGNKQFTIRYKIGGTYTEFSQISKEASVFIRDITAYNGGGGAPNTVTTKAITLSLKNMKPDSFEFFQIGVIEYTGGAVSSFVLGDFPVQGTEFDITLKGNENKQTLDIALFQNSQPIIKTAHLNTIIENKYFLGRIELETDPDVAFWVENTMFASSNIVIDTYALPSSGTAIAPIALSEYQDNDNIVNRIGYMYDEKYVLGVRFNLTNGLKTPPYYGREIAIVNDITGQLGNLTDASATEVYVYFPALLSVDFTTAPDIDGVPFIEAVESFEIVRSEALGRVIDTGIMLMPNLFGDPIPDPIYGTVYRCGGSFTNNVIPSDPILLQDRGAFVSQGILSGLNTISASGDKVFVNYGCPNKKTEYSTLSLLSPNKRVILTEYTGHFGGSPSPETLTVESGGMTPFNSIYQFSDSISISYEYLAPRGSANNSSTGFTFKLTSSATNQSIYTNYYGYYAACIDTALQFGDRQNIKFVSTGEFFLMGNTPFNILIFGGDTYTQKCFHKTIYKGEDVNGTYRGGISYYAQNKFNAQMDWTEETIETPVFPIDTGLGGGAIEGWLFNYESTQEPRLYDAGFTYSNEIRASLGYNPDIPIITKYDASVFYSDEKLEGDLGDPYRVFRFANMKTYEMSDGILTGLYKIRESLAVLQTRALRIQPISSTVTIPNSDVTGLILGTGSVLGTKETVVSRYGATHKTSSEWYKAESGTEYVVYYDAENKKILRYGIDGIKPLSDTNFVSRFLLNNTKDISAEYDMVVKYNPFTDEVYFIANQPMGDEHNILLDYAEGAVVFEYKNREDPTYYLNGQSFIAREDVAAGVGLNYRGESFDKWAEYRNCNFMLVFSESRNSFTGFQTFKPRFGAVYLNSFVGFFPYINASDQRNTDALEFNMGDNSTFIYDVFKLPSVEISISPLANLFKRFLKSWVNIDGGLPLRAIVESDNGTAAKIESFTERRGRVLFNILKDFYGTGQRVGGNKLRARLYFLYNQKIHNFVSTIISKDRKP